MTDTIRLTLNPDAEALQYDIEMIQGVDPVQSKDAVSIAPPGRAPNENILLGIQGMQADITITFAAWVGVEDASNGTAAGTDFFSTTVSTLAEHRRWLENYLHDPSFDASWTLDHVEGDQFNEDEVFVERVNVPGLQVDSPRWVQARIDLRRGQSF